ncbi:hypothetical protein CDL15_Pgr025463 [Punica granatum]|uniref:Peptidyl-tRNA hydrolase, mitochondrial n=1 Tax=Punica granatum TaxID=22663 RepID=A0A218W9D9_PUNGR|nr:hypothetical protein CDL15_Pgr025463 [Punica granatum]
MISRRCFCTATSRPWLFIGLGNPGDKYRGTRHNVGFEMIDAFAESQGILMDTVHCKALFGQGTFSARIFVVLVSFVDDAPVILAKPQTYMNLSGESTGPLAAYYKLPLNRFHDDMDLPCGVLRLQPKGGHGSIGRPPGQMDPKAFLLQKFNATARGRSCGIIMLLRSIRKCCNVDAIFCFISARKIDVALQEGVGALKHVLSKGLTESARCFNREQKYKHLRLQTLPA